MTDSRLPVLPLRDVVFYPYVVMPLLVGRQSSLAAVDAAVRTDGAIFLVAQQDGQTEDPASADLYRVGVVARVHQAIRQPNGTAKVLVEGLSRARVTRYVPIGGYLRATLDKEPPPHEDESTVNALARRSVVLFEEYVGLHRRIPPEVVALVQSAAGAERQAFGIAAHLGIRHETRQMLLEMTSLTKLLHSISDVLSAEVDLLRLERKIDDEVRGSLVQNQREFYLQEQLKAIHRELGQDDSVDAIELEAQVEQRGLPEPARARTLREVRKLRRMSPLSPEATVTRNYVDWILGLPWTERTEDLLDLAHARTVLDEDHYGLEEVKDRVLDFISVLSLVGKIEGPILCLVGPPGVGKTSLGKSIARALGRKFVRMSLGGVRDEAEIRGHRRTYVGALPGRVIQAMRRAEVVNPVLLLDEVDKLGQDYRGDPSAALLEVLDPEQNRTFNDHYLEIDYDLSQVLFITTANYLPQIPEPLRDRMELIRLSGYLDQEKHAIARQFLIPRQLRANGIDPAMVSWEPEVLPAILRQYTREAGVRELERRIARVSRKLARRTAEALEGADVDGADPVDPEFSIPMDGPLEATERVLHAASLRRSLVRRAEPLVVRFADLKALLGPAPHDTEALTLESKVGVATGLAYTNVGGDVLEVEVSVVGGRGKLQLTGTLGDVMKESANAALSYVRARSTVLGVDRDFHRSRDIHVHIPAGATPKDGPSAGISIATAMVSALTGIPIRGDVAMTGEITLRGRVLTIGGLREKAVAAHRNGIRHVIVPHDNLRDVDDFPEEVRNQVRFHGVKSMDEVLALSLVRTEYIGAPAAAPLSH